MLGGGLLTTTVCKRTQVSSAFACLSDGERRAYYDRTGREACNNVGHAHHDPEDIFRLSPHASLALSMPACCSCCHNSNTTRTEGWEMQGLFWRRF